MIYIEKTNVIRGTYITTVTTNVIRGPYITTVTTNAHINMLSV